MNSYMNFTTTCNESTIDCECVDYLQFYEPPYDESIYGQQTCGQIRQYRSRTRMLAIKYTYDASSAKAFALEYVSESG